MKSAAVSSRPCCAVLGEWAGGACVQEGPQCALGHAPKRFRPPAHLHVHLSTHPFATLPCAVQVLRSMAEEGGGQPLGERQLEQALGVVAALAGGWSAGA